VVSGREEGACGPTSVHAISTYQARSSDIHDLAFDLPDPAFLFGTNVYRSKAFQGPQEVRHFGRDQSEWDLSSESPTSSETVEKYGAQGCDDLRVRRYCCP